MRGRGTLRTILNGIKREKKVEGVGWSRVPGVFLSKEYRYQQHRSIKKIRRLNRREGGRGVRTSKSCRRGNQKKM